jgi:hypothetical protein
MELEYALLADAAQVSEGKTFILGGGISILWRSQYPAPIGVVLVLQLAHHRSEAGTSHDIKVQFNDADGHPVIPELQGTIQIGAPPEHLPSTLPLGAPIVLAFPPIPALHRPGSYAVEILVDGRHVKSLPISVAYPQQESLPPGA